MRHYCTYFDSIYAPRGLIMIGSLLRYQPDAVIHVLCLDDLCHQILEVLAPQMPGLRPIRLSDLESFDEELKARKPLRSKIEYYFTLTPSLPSFILAQNPEIESITYLDGDLYFYRDPELIFDEIGDHSIAIVPHRFSAQNLDQVMYGIYNVAWITWRNDANGRLCLSEYRTNCLEWCFDRVEPTRFADQKYLDAWPHDYQGVKILEQKGINLALWNVDNYRLSLEGDQVMVDDQPLIFYHFQNIKYLGPNSFHCPSFVAHKVEHNLDLLMQGLYRPYLDLLEVTSQQIAAATGINFYVDQRNNPAMAE